MTDEPVLVPQHRSIRQLTELDYDEMDLEAWQTIREIASDKTKSEATRLRAAEYILARRYGTPSSEAELIRARRTANGELAGEIHRVFDFVMPMNVEGTTPELPPAQDD